MTVSEIGTFTHKRTAANPVVSKTGYSAHEVTFKGTVVSETGTFTHERTTDHPVVSKTGHSAHKVTFNGTVISKTGTFTHKRTATHPVVSKTNHSAHEVTLNGTVVSKTGSFIHKRTAANPVVSKTGHSATKSQNILLTGTMKHSFGKSISGCDSYNSCRFIIFMQNQWIILKHRLYGLPTKVKGIAYTKLARFFNEVQKSVIGTFSTIQETIYNLMRTY